jgi:hypothetical protein
VTSSTASSKSPNQRDPTRSVVSAKAALLLSVRPALLRFAEGFCFDRTLLQSWLLKSAAVINPKMDVLGLALWSVVGTPQILEFLFYKQQIKGDDFRRK